MSRDEIPQRIKLLVDKFGGVLKFSKLVGTNLSTAQAWIREDKPSFPNSRAIVDISLATNCSVVWLLYGRGEPFPEGGSDLIPREGEKSSLGDLPNVIDYNEPGEANDGRTRLVNLDNRRTIKRLLKEMDKTELIQLIKWAADELGSRG